MSNLNSILIEGNLVREPLFRTTPKGTPVCTFRLASNRFYKQDAGVEKEVSFFDIETWTKLAELCNSQGRKGRGVRIVGRLKEERWADPEGKSRSKIKIIANHVEFRPDFLKDPAVEKHVEAVAKSGVTLAPHAGEEVNPEEERYLEEDEAASEAESRLMANVPEPAMF